ncbi:LamG-like jellyroll fold domain-containing protein [Amycolatopsis sp. NPDC006131]|uniref:LamG-like jellyroll fold domain-containing protein n=1 Tax=Amycolatopsis sp. NPDC006131 TaxID=3156731 RepID=UPI0033BF367E
MAGRFTTSTVPLDYPTTAPDPAAGITVLMWAYLTASTGTWSEVWRLRDTGGTTKFFFGAGANGTELTGASIAGSFPTSPTAMQFTAGTWHRLAMTVTGTTGTVYGAGATGPVSTGTGTVSGGGTAGAYALGGRSASDLSENWNGRIAAVKVYSAALTVAEIENEWAQYVPSRVANLYGWYPLVNATDLADLSGNGRTLTAGSPAPVTEDGPPIPWQRLRPRIITTPPVTSTPVVGSDTGTLAEAASVAASRTVTDTASTAAETATVTATRTVADTATATETATVTVTHSRTETGTASELVAGFARTLADAATAVDTAHLNTNPTAQVDITVHVGPTRTFTAVGATRALNDGLVIDPTRLL